jgi:large subunit ribosomal protein L25
VSDKDITLVLTPRDQVGKGLGQLRRDGSIPAVIHIPGKDSVIVTGNYLDVMKVYHLAGRHHPIDLQVGDDKYFTIIKDVDIEPTKHILRHVVFDTINRNEKVETEVAVELIGDAPAGKVGLVINKLIYELKIEALPRDLPDKLEANIDNLAEVGDKITVADLVLPQGVTILAEPEHVIAQVEEPTIQAVEEPEAEAPAEGEATSEETPAEGEATSEESKE